MSRQRCLTSRWPHLKDSEPAVVCSAVNPAGDGGGGRLATSLMILINKGFEYYYH